MPPPRLALRLRLRCALAGALLGLAPPALALDPLDVAVSVPVQADWLKRIGGEHVRTRVVVPEGVEPEDFTLGPATVEGLAKADVYIGVGHPLFPFERLEVVPALQRAGVPYLPLVPDATRESDPRPWTSLRTVADWLPGVAERLAELDVENAATYREKADAYLAEIRSVDRSLGRRLSARRQRTLVVAHPLWSAFCRDYGLDQLALTREGEELGPRDLVPLVEGLGEWGVSRIFVHPRLSRRGAVLVARQIDAELVELDPDAVPWLANVRRTGEAFLSALESRGAAGAAR